MSRRSLFYVVNLIFPCLLIYAVSFLGFFLPTESGDKVNLEITVLLALVVFLLIAGETLPPTPDVIPVLGLYRITVVLRLTTFGFAHLCFLKIRYLTGCYCWVVLVVFWQTRVINTKDLEIRTIILSETRRTPSTCGNGPPSQKMVCAQVSTLNQWRSEGRCIGDSCPSPGRPRRRREPDHLGEFLNAPVTIVNGLYVRRHVLLVGHKRKSRLNGASYQ